MMTCKLANSLSLKVNDMENVSEPSQLINERSPCLKMVIIMISPNTPKQGKRILSRVKPFLLCSKT